VVKGGYCALNITNEMENRNAVLRVPSFSDEWVRVLYAYGEPPKSNIYYKLYAEEGSYLQIEPKQTMYFYVFNYNNLTDVSQSFELGSSKTLFALSSSFLAFLFTIFY